MIISFISLTLDQQDFIYSACPKSTKVYKVSDEKQKSEDGKNMEALNHRTNREKKTHLHSVLPDLLDLTSVGEE